MVAWLTALRFFAIKNTVAVVLVVPLSRGLKKVCRPYSQWIPVCRRITTDYYKMQDTFISKIQPSFGNTTIMIKSLMNVITPREGKLSVDERSNPANVVREDGRNNPNEMGSERKIDDAYAEDFGSKMIAWTGISFSVGAALTILHLRHKKKKQEKKKQEKKDQELRNLEKRIQQTKIAHYKS
jgi:hypothetical protein